MKLKNPKVTNSLIIFIAIIMLFINSTTMFLVKNITEKSMINTEYKYLEKTVNTIRDTTELIVFEYISICDVLSKNQAYIEMLRDSDQNNPMAEHEKVDLVVEAMSNFMDSYDGKIMSMAIFDIEQDSYLLNTGDVSGDDFSFKDRPYYEPVLTGNFVVTEPYLDVLTDGLVVTIACPIFDNFNNNDILGVVGLDLPIDFVSKLVLENTYGDSGRSLVLSENNKILGYSDTSYIDKDYSSLKMVGAELESELINPTGNLVEYDMMGEKRLGIVIELDSLNWKILTGMNYSEFDQISSIIIVLMLISATMTMIVCGLLISGKLTKELLALSYVDNLTGLSNRVGFSAKVEDLIKNKPQSIGIVSININGLKNINETSGLSTGDVHIKNVTKMLQEHFTNFEFFRMYGDEMIGLAIEAEKEMFISSVEKLHEIMKITENFDFSFGHAFSEIKYDLWNLIKEAEAVMFINKQEYYASNHKSSSSKSNDLLFNLLSSIEEEEFMVYLQPQVYLSDGSLYGAEALIRKFDKKNKKMVFPDEFIPLYEKNSIIRHVDLFVVETICKLLAELDKDNKAMPISVNLSRVTLQEYGIVDSIVRICDNFNVPHNYLVIEVTERVGLVENNVASELIQKFKDNGFHISLDDFGCAYSNIITLAQIEVDEVKIDKSLVDNVISNSKNKVLVRNVLSMCNQLDGTSTLAEGIEHANQAELLKEMGCLLGQGYLYSRPIPITEFLDKFVK